jgi:transcriptional regulator with XRE-family HTH domain
MARNNGGILSLSMSEMSLGAALRAARGDRTLRDMEALTGVNFSLLARIENGKVEMPGRETLAAISRGYGLPLEYLAQLVYLGRRPEERDAADDTPHSDVARSPAENEPPCEKAPPGRRRRRLAGIS